MIIEWSSGCAKAANKNNRDWVLNKKPVLLLHCDGTDESQTFKDSSPSAHTVTANGTAQIDTAQSKWGASGLFDGNSDYLSIPDHANWDIATNFTIALWARLGSSKAQVFIRQHEDTGNYWELMIAASNDIAFNIKSTTSVIVNLINAGTFNLSVGSWQLLIIAKVGNEYGGYVGGVQKAYLSDADMDTFAGSLYIGSYSSGGYYDGHLDEIAIWHSNPFGAAPVVGLTDTIIVPIKPYISWR